MLEEKYRQSIFSRPVEIALRNLVLRLVLYFNFFFHQTFLLCLRYGAQYKWFQEDQDSALPSRNWIWSCHIGIKDEVHRRDSGDTKEEVVISIQVKRKNQAYCWEEIMFDLNIQRYIPKGSEICAVDYNREKHEYSVQWFIGIYG